MGVSKTGGTPFGWWSEAEQVKAKPICWSPSQVSFLSGEPFFWEPEIYAGITVSQQHLRVAVRK